MPMAVDDDVKQDPSAPQRALTQAVAMQMDGAQRRLRVMRRSLTPVQQHSSGRLGSCTST